MRFVRAWLMMALTALLLSILWNPPDAVAWGLKSAGESLDDGDGMRLQPIPRTLSNPAADFAVSFQQRLDFLNTAIVFHPKRFTLNSTLAALASDVERDIPAWTAESRSPFFAERTSTLEAEKLNTAFAYPRLDFTRFEATSPKNLSPTFNHGYMDHGGVFSMTGPFRFWLTSEAFPVNLNLGIEQDVFLFASYSLMRPWDVGILLPILTVLPRADGHATLVSASAIGKLVHNFEWGADSLRSMGKGEEAGIGDVIFQTQYNFVRGQPGWPELSMLGQIKFPTGDKNDFLGNGETNLRALLAAYQSFGRLTPHANLSFEWTTEGPKQNNLSYGAGLYGQVHHNLTLALDVFGRWAPNADNIANNPVNLVLGATYNPFRAFLLNASVLLPMNQSAGFHPDVIWTVRVEYTF